MHTENYNGYFNAYVPERKVEVRTSELLQGSDKRWAPGCVNAAGKAGGIENQQHKQNSPNLGLVFQPSPVLLSLF